MTTSTDEDLDLLVSSDDNIQDIIDKDIGWKYGGPKMKGGPQMYARTPS